MAVQRTEQGLTPHLEVVPRTSQSDRTPSHFAEPGSQPVSIPPHINELATAGMTPKSEVKIPDSEKLKIQGETVPKLFQSALEFFTARPRLKLTSEFLQAYFQMHQKEIWDRFLASKPDKKAVNLLLDQIVIAVEKAREKSPVPATVLETEQKQERTVPMMPPEFPRELIARPRPEAAVSQPVSPDDDTVPSAVVDVETPSAEEAATSQNATPEATSTDMLGALFSKQLEIGAEKRGIAERMRAAVDSVRSRMETRQRIKAYQEAMASLRDEDAAVEVVLLDRDETGKTVPTPQSRPIVARADSVFTEEKGIPRQKLFKQEPPIHVEGSVYTFERHAVAVQPVESWTDVMQADPVEVLLNNIGAELSLPETAALEQIRVGARELQKTMLQTVQNIEANVQEVKTIVAELEALHSDNGAAKHNEATSERLASSQQKILEAVNTQRLEIIKEESGRLKIIFMQMINHVVTASTLVNRYGMWSEDVIRPTDPIYELLEGFNAAFRTVDTWSEYFDLLESKRADEDKQKAMLAEMTELFSASTFENQIAHPLMKIFEHIQERTVAVYQEFLDHDPDHLASRVDAYSQALDLGELDPNTLLSLAEKHVPELDTKLDALIQHIDTLGLPEDDQEGQVYNFLLAQIFGRYEAGIQAEYNRLVDGMPKANEATKRNIFDSYTNVIEEVAHYSYAQEKVVHILTPLLHRISMVLSRRIAEDDELFQKLSATGILPPPQAYDSMSAADVRDHLENWLNTLMTDETESMQEKEVYMREIISMLLTRARRFSKEEREAYTFMVDPTGSYEMEMFGDTDFSAFLSAGLTGGMSWQQGYGEDDLFAGFGMPDLPNGARMSDELESTDGRGISTEDLLSPEYLTRAQALLAVGSGLEDSFVAATGLTQALEKLMKLLPKEMQNDSEEFERILDNADELYAILYSLADVRDGKPDGIASGEYMLETAQIMDQTVDALYTDSALQIQQALMS